MRKITTFMLDMAIVMSVILKAQTTTRHDTMNIRQQIIVKIAIYAEFVSVIERFLKEHLLADLFERDVLSYTERELATMSLISVLGESVEPMLRGHLGISEILVTRSDNLSMPRI